MTTSANRAGVATTHTTRIRIRLETLERWEGYEATGERISGRAIAAWLETWGTDKEGKCPAPGD